MTELQAEEEEAEWLRLTKPQNDVHARVSSPMPLTSLANLPSNSCLFALSNVWGLVFIGDEGSIKIHSLPTLNTLLTTPKPPTSDLSPTSDPLAKIDLASRPVWIRLAMGDKKLVVGMRDGGVGVWDVKNVLGGKLSPSHSFSPLPTPLLNLLPNPSVVGGLPHLVLALSEDKLDVLSIKEGEYGVVGGLEGNFTCVAWSVKGKQFVTGKPDGTLEQYSPDGSKKAEIPAPPSLLESGTYQPTSVAWLENDLFLVTYGPSPPDADSETKPRQYIISRQPKSTPPSFTYTSIDEYFLSGYTDRPGTFRELALLKNWGGSKHLAFIIAQSTPEVGILRCSQSTNEWSQLDLDENARAALPFQELGPDSDEGAEAEEAIPLGVEIDLTPTESIKRPMEGGLPVPDLPPMPRLLVYSSDGVIVSYDIRNTEAGAFDGMIVPRDILTAEEASMEDAMDANKVETKVEVTKPSAPAPPASTVPAVLPFGATVPGAKPSFGFGGAKKLPSLGGGGGGFGTTSTPAFGSSGFGSTPTFGSSGFGATPTFGSSGFGGASGSGSSTPAASSSSGMPTAFGGSGTTTPAFGGSGSGSSVSAFAAAATKPAGAFASATSGAFGGSASGGAFGSSTPAASKPNPFGAFGSTSAFGSTTPTPATGAFGQSKPSGAFGASTFGQRSGFGGSAGPTASPSLFGGSPAAPKPATSPFGASTFGAGATASTFGFGNAKPATTTQTNMFAPLQSQPASSAFGGMDVLGYSLGAEETDTKAAEPSSPESVVADRAGSESPTKVDEVVQPLFSQPGLFSGGESGFGGPTTGAFGQTAPSAPKVTETSTPVAPSTKSSPFGSSGFGEAAAASSGSVFGSSGFGAPKPATVAAPASGGGFGGFAKSGVTSAFGSSGFEGAPAKPEAAAAPEAGGGFGGFTTGGTASAFGSSGFGVAAPKPAAVAAPAAGGGFGGFAKGGATPAFGASGFGSIPSKAATTTPAVSGGGFGGFSKGGFGGFATPPLITTSASESSTARATTSATSLDEASSKTPVAGGTAEKTSSVGQNTSTSPTSKADPLKESAASSSAIPVASSDSKGAEPKPTSVPIAEVKDEEAAAPDDEAPVAAEDELASEGDPPSPPSGAGEEQMLSSPDKLTSSGTGSRFSSSAEESRESEDELADEEADEEAGAHAAEVAPVAKPEPQAFTGWGAKPLANKESSGADKWKCTTCDTSWPQDKDVCGACESRRPGAKPPAVSANPFASFGIGPSSVAGPSSSPQGSPQGSLFGFAPPASIAQPHTKTLSLGFRMPSSTPAVRSPLATDALAYPASPSPFQKDASTSSFFNIAPPSRALTPAPVPFEQAVTSEKPRDKYDFAREEIQEQGIAGQFAHIYQDLQFELDKLHSYAIEQTDRYTRVKRGANRELVSAKDIESASQWPFDQLDLLRDHGHSLEIMASEAREAASELDDQLDGLLDTFYKVQLQLAECERLTKAKSNPGMTRRLRVRKLGPVQEREQATLRALNKDLVDKMDEVETALARLRKRIARQRTGQSPVRNNTWHTTQAAIRDTTARIREQQLNIDDLVSRVGRVGIEPSETSGSRRGSFSETESETDEAEKPVKSDVRVSAALNGEAFGVLLRGSVSRSTARIVTCQHGPPAMSIKSNGVIVTETKKTPTTPRARIPQAQPSPQPIVPGGFNFGIAPASTMGLKGLGLGKAPSRSQGRNTLHLQGPRASPSALASVPSVPLNFFRSER